MHKYLIHGMITCKQTLTQTHDSAVVEREAMTAEVIHAIEDEFTSVTTNFNVLAFFKLEE